MILSPQGFWCWLIVLHYLIEHATSPSFVCVRPGHGIVLADPQTPSNGKLGELSSDSNVPLALGSRLALVFAWLAGAVELPGGLLPKCRGPTPVPDNSVPMRYLAKVWKPVTIIDQTIWLKCFMSILFSGVLRPVRDVVDDHLRT